MRQVACKVVPPPARGNVTKGDKGVRQTSLPHTKNKIKLRIWQRQTKVRLG